MEWLTTVDGKYRIESLTPATFSGAMKIIRESFCPEENVCIGTEVNINPVATEELMELCADAALDGASLVAIATESGEVAAVAFNKLQSIGEGENFYEVFTKERCSQPSVIALMTWLVDIEARCNFLEKYGVDCSLEILFLGTDRKHRKKNLGTLLCLCSIELAKKLKDGPVAKITVKDLGPSYSHLKSQEVDGMVPKICHALFTTEATQKIGKSLGFTVVWREPFKNFIYNGKTFEERIGREVCAEAVAKKIY